MVQVPSTQLDWLLVQRLGTDKIEILARMAESYQVQLTEKREELETARRRARQTKDDELAEHFLRDAEQLNAAIHLLEKEYAEASAALENFNTGNAWIYASIERIRRNLPVDTLPTVEDIKALSYEDRRMLLDGAGVYVQAFPREYTERIKVLYQLSLGTDHSSAIVAWAMEQEQSLHTRFGSPSHVHLTSRQ